MDLLIDFLEFGKCNGETSCDGRVVSGNVGRHEVVFVNWRGGF